MYTEEGGGRQAPFKLTSELVDVMGGRDSAAFGYFRELVVQVKRRSEQARHTRGCYRTSKAARGKAALGTSKAHRRLLQKKQGSKG